MVTVDRWVLVDVHMIGLRNLPLSHVRLVPSPHVRMYIQRPRTHINATSQAENYKSEVNPKTRTKWNQKHLFLAKG